MLKVTDAVRDIINSSEVALTALSHGYLNLSAYAETIKPAVERRVKKPVQVGTIVVALSRLSKAVEQQESLLPVVEIESIAVKTGLVELTFDRSKVNRDKLQKLYQDDDFVASDFFAVTHGIGELSIVIPESLKKNVLKVFSRQVPKLLLDKLASVTVRFEERYLQIPNVTFAILRSLALKRINVLETVSTFTELTFILHQDDLQESFVTLSAFLKASR